jgi:predicted nucleic acid-binding protein
VIILDTWSTGARLALDQETIPAGILGARIVPFDSAAAKEYATLTAQRIAAGHPISIEDAQIAAIVRANGATLVTRDVSHFQDCGFEVINPWK